MPKMPKMHAAEESGDTADRMDMDDILPIFILSVLLSAFLLIFIFVRMYLRWSVACPSDKTLEGKTVIITGGSSGIGRATAIELAKRGARVVLACRNVEKAEAVARFIKSKTGNQNIFSSKLELESLASIKEFVEEFNSKEDRLHILINNAGWLGPQSSTEDGLETTFAVNYLGHFYLTHLLMEKLKKFAPSRIINVVSDGYTSGKLDFDDLDELDLLKENYTAYGAYCRSKLALVVFTQELHRRFSSHVVLSFAAHPGCVQSELLRNYPGAMGKFLRLASKVLFKTPAAGAQTILYCALADRIKDHSGRMFQNCGRVIYKDFARDRELGQKLWNVSADYCGFTIDPNQERRYTIADVKFK